MFSVVVKSTKCKNICMLLMIILQEKEKEKILKYKKGTPSQFLEDWNMSPDDMLAVIGTNFNLVLRDTKCKPNQNIQVRWLV